jgi:hypothetical protein
VVVVMVVVVVVVVGGGAGGVEGGFETVVNTAVASLSALVSRFCVGSATTVARFASVDPSGAFACD